MCILSSFPPGCGSAAWRAARATCPPRLGGRRGGGAECRDVCSAERAGGRGLAGEGLPVRAGWLATMHLGLEVLSWHALPKYSLVCSLRPSLEAVPAHLPLCRGDQRPLREKLLESWDGKSESLPMHAPTPTKFMSSALQFVKGSLDSSSASCCRSYTEVPCLFLLPVQRTMSGCWRCKRQSRSSSEPTGSKQRGAHGSSRRARQAHMLARLLPARQHPRRRRRQGCRRQQQRSRPRSQQLRPTQQPQGSLLQQPGPHRHPCRWPLQAARQWRQPRRH